MEGKKNDGGKVYCTHDHIKKLLENFQGVRKVVPPGLEPGLTEPKPAVLPLHNGTIIFDGANIERFLFSNKKNDENSDKIIIFVLHYMR